MISTIKLLCLEESFPGVCDITKIKSIQSNFIVDIIIHILPITRDTLSFIVRKCAHMTEYAILTFLLYKTFVHKQNPLIKSFLFTVLYACSDEFHQLFIPGRAGQIRDVCIDSYWPIPTYVDLLFGI